MKFIYILTILNFLHVQPVAASCREHGELHFVVVVFRHGDRAPIKPYPKDPFHSDSCWPNGWGQLTNLGKLQQFELGKWLRNRYCKFLPLDYSPHDIYVMASDVDRTLVSAYSNLAGLYEEWLKENKVRDLEWIAIPVHTIPQHLDSLLVFKKPCPAYDRLLKNLVSSEEVEIVNEYYEDLFRALSEHSGMKITNVVDSLQLYGTLHVESLHGFQLPSWTKKYFPEPLKEIAEFASKLSAQTTQLKRLRCGPLLKDILKHIDDKKDCLLKQKMWIYSAHDSTISNLLQCMNVYDGAIPPYTATLIFELYRKSAGWWLMVSYKTPTTIQVLRIPQCERLCPLESFKKLVKPVIPGDWDEECRNSTEWK
ncbi:UNVERIFIED_CONTAM: hypothetical protein PYX00_003132 [Menopon gallinae]|uniref:acid phosphatase n=1 Tax=Menopon gallinae TaxID=328185 RepID=A0AAW2HZN6_9NEOP